MKVNYENATWEHLINKLVKGKCDREDDIDYYPTDEQDPMGQKRIWTAQTNGIACWWEPGHNEGYYMECRPIKDDNVLQKEGVMGKFWSPKEAERCNALAQRFINNLKI